MNFVNPYSFIPLRKGKKEKYDSYVPSNSKLLTGKIKCHLITKTELIIPDNKNEDKKVGMDEKGKRAYYDEYMFMSIDDKPTIPGSSLRGMFRNAFEIITDSCMFVNDDYFFSSRTGKPKIAGLLKRTADGYELLPTQRYSDKKQFTQKYMTGDLVSFDGRKNARGNANYVTEVGRGTKRGYVLIVKDFGNKGSRGYATGRSIFEKLSDTPDAKFLDNDGSIRPIEAFEDNISKYVKDGAWQFKKYSDRFEKFKKNEGDIIPVWYEKYEGKYYLALSQMSRNVYTKKPADFLSSSSLNLTACKDYENNEICPACALFGIIKGAESKGSRVRFSDAECRNEDKKILSAESILMPILSSPRSSSLEFYLLGEGDFYHADYDDVGLSGRKFYWHHSNFDINKLASDKNPNMTCYMQYAKKNALFEFEVYFDGITENELRQLYTALTFNDNDKNEDLCHKLGHGKPLGFGSVKITVNELTTREYIKASGEYIQDNEYLNQIKGIPISDKIKMAVGFRSVQGQKIDYPRKHQNGNIYEWFSANRKIGHKNKYELTLPKLGDENQTLPYNPEDKRSAANHDKPKDTTIDNKDEPKNTPFKDLLSPTEKTDEIDATHTYETFKSTQLKDWLLEYRRDNKTVKNLKMFVSEFERAAAEGDDRYKHIAHHYEPAKAKLRKLGHM